MPTFLIQVEAVNLSNVVYDTHDLSTIRGGSFMLLTAIQEMAAAFQGRMTSITTAASQGLFTVDESAQSIHSLEQAILADLETRTGGHATFLVASEPDNGDFPLVLARLQAQIRRQQWRMPTVRVPADEAAADACFLDGWRPAVSAYRVDPTRPRVKISRATEFRRRYGRRVKDSIFQAILSDPAYDENLCAKDLNRLASDPSKGTLDGKIALIHIDGNRFGSIRRALCTTPETRQAFDQQIQQGCREPFLRALLNYAKSDPAFQTRDDEGNAALRIEILLWGGDEMTLVVPAWRGWKTIDLYYQQANTLCFQGVSLSHRAAIIFCHHNAPILQIRRMAEELLERTREDIKSGFAEAVESHAEIASLSLEARQQSLAWLANHALGNALHYLTLKSFDMLGSNLESFLQKYYAESDYRQLLIRADEMASMGDHLKQLHTHVAKGKVLEIVRALQTQNDERIAQMRSRLLEMTESSVRQSVTESLDALVAEKAGRWQLIADLWDFAPEWHG
jgi:hypothetical protein